MSQSDGSVGPHEAKSIARAALISPPVSRNPLERPNAEAGPSKLHFDELGAVKGRRGSVLSRGLILKSDHYSSGAMHSGLQYLRSKQIRDNRSSTRFGPLSTGRRVSSLCDLAKAVSYGTAAPNFRPAPASLGIYGSAQPSATGLRSILATLGCTRTAQAPRKVAWISTREEPIVYLAGRPFVLREATHPKRNLNISHRAENLESLESRLKQDILNEARNHLSLILVHEEVDDQLLPTWVASSDVQTPVELFESIAAEDDLLEYHRIPISSDQDPSDNYVDRFVKILRALPLDSAVVFNCGMGAVRTTYAMSVALIMRRKQCILQGLDDPFCMKEDEAQRANTMSTEAYRGMQQVQEQRDRNRSLLLLMSLLEETFVLRSTTNLIDAVTSHPRILEQLGAALAGRYEILLSLVSCLEQGPLAKTLVDRIIDENAAVVHLRHQILALRLRYVSTARDETEKRNVLLRALKALERYLFLVAFAAYVEESEQTFAKSFFTWIGERSEIRNMIRRMRATKQLFVFAPVHDLSAIGAAEASQVSTYTNLGRTRYARIVREGGELVDDKWAEQIVHRRTGSTLRAGTILKQDVWKQSGSDEGHEQLRGTSNFRCIPSSNLYALAQPTEDGIGQVLRHVSQEKGQDAIWLNLREEPITYINGVPYVLREMGVSLRNMKSYAGISRPRIEGIEDRLKADVLAELRQHDGRLLLHIEQADGTIIPIWERADAEDIKTLREVMESQSRQQSFDYRRIPMTAERSPDIANLDDILDLVVGVKSTAIPIIINCQLGRGRSTMASIAIYLSRQWLSSGGRKNAFCGTASYTKTVSFKVIGNLLRLMPHGKDVKSAVDTAVRDCAELVDLVDSIERKRRNAEGAREDETKRKAQIEDGLNFLHRYFNFLLFAAYLNQLQVDNARHLKQGQSLEAFVLSRPVYATIEKEIDDGGASSLVPLEQVENEDSDGDFRDHVLKRSGQILGPSTLLKSDMFLGLQKLSLPERVDGAPNFRIANLILASPTISSAAQRSQGFSATDGTSKLSMTPLKASDGSGEWLQATERAVFGSGQPTVKGAKAALLRMSAGPHGDREIIWTSMREEPILYVNDKPYVLRLLDDPLENVITTGVTAEAVESQEDSLKEEVLREAASHGGKVLLHDEVEGDGGFSLTAAWEPVNAKSVLTPLDLYEGLIKDGYRVNYARVPVTDEQAPIPGVFARLEERIRHSLSKGGKAFAFNCQMGRGRTTTAMVACVLIYNILESTHLDDLPRVGRSISSSFIVDERVAAQLDADEVKSIWGDEREMAALSRGDYRIILRLVSLLSNGTLAKQLTDQAINQCDAVQNLRTAVLDYRKRAESVSAGKRHERLRSIAQSYLFRYGILIAFAGYLLEKSDAKETQNVLFPEWLEKREISRLLEQTEEDII